MPASKDETWVIVRNYQTANVEFFYKYSKVSFGWSREFPDATPFSRKEARAILRSNNGRENIVAVIDYGLTTEYAWRHDVAVSTMEADRYNLSRAV